MSDNLLLKHPIAVLRTQNSTDKLYNLPLIKLNIYWRDYFTICAITHSNITTFSTDKIFFKLCLPTVACLINKRK